MAEPRRGSGQVREQILHLLRRGTRPMRASELTEMLVASGHRVPASLVFRAIRDLVGRGAIRKIHLAGGYAPVSEDPAIVLWCRACGCVTEVRCVEAFDSLGNAAAAAGLAVSHYVVEVPGLCSTCAAMSPREAP